MAAFLARCRAAAAENGLVVRYLDRADLIRMRRAIGRPKDLRRVGELERLASRSGLGPDVREEGCGDGAAGEQ